MTLSASYVGLLLILTLSTVLAAGWLRDDDDDDNDNYDDVWARASRFFTRQPQLQSLLRGNAVKKRSSSHMLLVTQPWLRGPSLHYRRVHGPSRGAVEDSTIEASGPAGTSGTSAGEHTPRADDGLRAAARHDARSESRSSPSSAVALSWGPERRQVTDPNDDDDDDDAYVDEVVNRADDDDAAAGASGDECEQVCSTCRYLVSIRVAALCPLECHLGGRSYDICKVVWALQHT